MISFKQFLQEDFQTKMTIEEMVKLAKQSCSDAMTSDTKIYRGQWPVFTGLVQGEKGERVSRNTSNHYTLIFDHVLGPLGYPLRSKSIICSTSGSIAAGYGATHRILPFDDVKIGVCPSRDMFDTEVKFIDRKLPVYRLNDRFGDYRIADTTYAQLFDDLLEKYNPVKDKSKEEVEKLIQDRFSPEATGIKLATTKTLSAIASGEISRELWLGGKCLMISLDHWKDFEEAYNAL